MKNVLDCIIRALLMLWELPQNILGALLFIFFAVFSDYSEILDDDDSLEMYSPMMRGAITLGIFRVYAYKYLGNGARYVELVRKHEKGHRKQSVMLGPLYLIVIGLPSLIWAALHSTVRRLGTVDYFSFYTERWADRLGGVKR